MKTHRDLDVWKESMDLVVEAYCVTKRLPREEVFGLTSQIRRAAVSVAENISEEAGRRSSKELRKFLYYSFGSLSELETHLQICLWLGYLDSTTWMKLQGRKKRLRHNWPD